MSRGTKLEKQKTSILGNNLIMFFYTLISYRIKQKFSRKIIEYNFWELQITPTFKSLTFPRLITSPRLKVG